MMRPAASLPAVYLCREPVDFRKSINGLSALVEGSLSMNPFCEHVFVFINRKRDKVKCLYWERAGFVLWYKRLEKGHFHWPRFRAGEVITLTGQELNWLLDGAPQAHDGRMHGRAACLCKAVGEMTVGPSESAVRSRLQTTSSGCH